MQHVVGADDVGAHSLHGEEFAGGYLLQSRGVEDVVHAVHRVAHGLGVAHVADEEPHLGGEHGAPLLEPVAHVVLLLLVAGEDADLLEVRVDEVLEHGVAEAARAACDHEGLACEVCHLYTPCYSFYLKRSKGNAARNSLRIAVKSGNSGGVISTISDKE